MSIWRNFEHILDDSVDAQFSEPIELHPWTEGSVSSEGGPDPDRSVLVTYGVFVMPGAKATGEGGTMGAGLSTRVVTNDVWVSIVEDRLGSDWTGWQKNDRVYLPERDAWFQLTYITPSATGRPNLNLIRLQAADVLKAPAPEGTPES